MNQKLIFVDDEEGSLELYEDIFKYTDYEVFTESSPKKALEIILREDILVIFLDLKIPEMNGVELCLKIRERSQIAIIYAGTGYSSLFELSNIREAGFDDYFKKPIDARQLLTAADRAFEKLERWTYEYQDLMDYNM